MSFLSVRNIVKSFGKTEVLKGTSFEMGSNTTLALIGKSGSGKTTMLRIIAGLELPDSGEIELNKKLLNSKNEYIKPEKRNIGYVFQNHSLFPHLDVYNNIVFGIRNQSKSQKLDSAMEYLSMLNLKDKLKSYPHELSGGEKQRISIIRTLASEPKLLLLDEPFSNLDKNTKEKLKLDLKQILYKENLPTIMITHDADDSFDLADETILIESGEIVASGQPEELYRNPVNEHSARFFSEAVIITRDEKNSKFFIHFDINSTRICISPQNINPKTNGLEAILINHKFVGNGYQLNLECLGANLKMFTIEKPTKDTINIDIKYIKEIH